MPKLQPVCPFSKKACKECGIFRGRHVSLCHYPQYQEHLWNRGDLIAGGQTVKKPITTNGSIWSEFPELPEKPAWLANIEDCTERRDG
jgi:hypothetical protein